MMYHNCALYEMREYNLKRVRNLMSNCEEVVFCGNQPL